MNTGTLKTLKRAKAVSSPARKKTKFTPRSPDLKVKEIFDASLAKKVRRLFKHLNLRDSIELFEAFMAKAKMGDNVGVAEAPYGRLADRLWNKKGIQGWSRRLRHTLCHLLYWDIDFAAAQATIISQLADQWGVAVPVLKNYLQKREELLKELMVSLGMNKGEDDPEVLHCYRDDAKDTLSAVFNGGMRMDERWPQWVKDLHGEIRRMGEYIEANEQHIWNEALQRAEEDKGEHYDGNPHGKAISLVYRRHEYMCLIAMLTHLKSRCLLRFQQKDDIAVLIHDGIQIPIPAKGKKIDPNALLRELEGEIKQRTGFSLTLAIKPMNEGITDAEFDAAEAAERPEGEVQDTGTVVEVEVEPLSLLAEEMVSCVGNVAVAEYVSKEVLGGLYKYCSFQKRWFVCVKNVWEWCKEPIDIKKLARKAIEGLVKSHGEDSKSWQKLQKKIRDNGFLKGVADSVKMYCKHDRFGECLDQNRSIIACRDQVINLETGEWEMLTPEHCVSKTTGYDRPEWNKDIYDEILHVINGMFLHPEDAGYVTAVLASMLFGGNTYQKIYFFLGEGANGKTLLFTLLMAALGAYVVSMDTAALTKSKRGQNEHSDWWRAFGARGVLFEEPEDRDWIQSAIMKLITGGGKLTSRPPYGSEPVEYVPLFKPMFTCNDIPNVNKASDVAIQRRMEALGMPHTFYFEDDPRYNPNNPRHKVRDRTLEGKFSTQEYGAQFLLFLSQVYQEYVKGQPSLNHLRTNFHRKTTENYFLDQDPVRRFFQDNYTIAGLYEDKIDYTEAFQEFKDSGEENRRMSPHEFRKGFEKLGIIKTASNGGYLLRHVKRREDDTETEDHERLYKYIHTYAAANTEATMEKGQDWERTSELVEDDRSVWRFIGQGPERGNEVIVLDDGCRDYDFRHFIGVCRGRRVYRFHDGRLYVQHRTEGRVFKGTQNWMTVFFQMASQVDHCEGQR